MILVAARPFDSHEFRRLLTVRTLCDLRTVTGFESLKNSATEINAPTEIFRTVRPKTVLDGNSFPVPTRRANAELRTREFLTSTEVDVLIEAARKNRNGHRDATAILVAFRHGLRAVELCDLGWDQVDFDGAGPSRPSGQERDA